MRSPNLPMNLCAPPFLALRHPDKNYLSVRLAPGLGDQLFQIATALATATRNGQVLLHPQSETNDLEVLFDRYVEVDCTYRSIPLATALQDILLILSFHSYKYFDTHKDLLVQHLDLKSQQLRVGSELDLFHPGKLHVRGAGASTASSATATPPLARSGR